MENKNIEKLRYPVGKYKEQENIPPEKLKEYIVTFEQFPYRLHIEIEKLDEKHLDTPYREGGWSIRQVIHHVADSHMNGYIRMKLALTENNPVIKPYYEDRWAELEDYKLTPTAISFELLDLLHKRWAILMKSLTPLQLKRTYHHPETNEDITLENQIGYYGWHSEHHLAHITELKKRMGWE